MGLFASDPRPPPPGLEMALADALFARRRESVRAHLRTRSVPSASAGATRARHRRRSHGHGHGHEPELPEIGTVLDGKYRIDEHIGTGGFAVVYRATHLLMNTSVAIKLLRPKMIKKRPGLAALLCDEARFAAKIQHPNVVSVKDVTHTPKLTYLVMEFIEGQTLSDVIHLRGRLAPDETLRIGMAVAAGLKAGVEQGLIHRDIKPSNIVLTAAGDTKIVDLGLAQPNVEGMTIAAEDRPDEGPVIGTPGYMAPEQSLAPEKVSFRADIYSLGVTLYHAAVGSPPFPTDDPARCLQMHRDDPVPLPESRDPTFPRPLSRLLLWMLAKNPAERPGSYEVLIRAMRAARSG
jgi:serine/threonine-protein kinase